MATIRLPIDFIEFLKLLNDHRVEYLIVGGFAVSYHGYPRSTGDIDIWIAMNAENAGRVAAAVREFGFADAGISPEMFLEPEALIRMGQPPLRIEILTTISGVDFTDAYANRISEAIDGVVVNVLSLNDLNGQQESRRTTQGFQRPGESALGRAASCCASKSPQPLPASNTNPPDLLTGRILWRRVAYPLNLSPSDPV